MKWKAPSVNVGKVTFYASLLSANNNGMNSGDEVYSTKTAAYQVPESAVVSPADPGIRIYPNPVTSGFWVELPENLEATSFALYNSSGTKVAENSTNDFTHPFIETNGLPTGVYFLAVESAERRIIKKIVVL